MASAGTVGKLSGNTCFADKLPDEINEMKIKDEKSEKEVEAAVADGNRTETGHIIVITIGGRKGQPKQIISYLAERVVGQGLFGIVFQAKCRETGETVAIDKVLRDKRFVELGHIFMEELEYATGTSSRRIFWSSCVTLEVQNFWFFPTHKVFAIVSLLNRNDDMQYLPLLLTTLVASLSSWRPEPIHFSTNSVILMSVSLVGGPLLPLFKPQAEGSNSGAPSEADTGACSQAMPLSRFLDCFD
ncbi:hypothetical protein TIFTF001_011730 [Ficus carica]|uniref:Uncharacterized protein n=1 Tax=Ficus carica TaxID=3494 RepID=A0AA87ZZ76_FICCA|nr:hypothetical protein TIFTF001_011730 [Ficus carica]